MQSKKCRLHRTLNRISRRLRDATQVLVCDPKSPTPYDLPSSYFSIPPKGLCKSLEIEKLQRHVPGEL